MLILRLIILPPANFHTDVEGNLTNHSSLWQNEVCTSIEYVCPVANILYLFVSLFKTSTNEANNKDETFSCNTVISE